MSQSAVGNDDYEAWRDLMDVLEERDREWWADNRDDDEDEDGQSARGSRDNRVLAPLPQRR